MDLIPADFRQAQWAKRFVRRLAKAFLLILGVCTAAWLLLGHLINTREQEIAQLREQDGSSQQQQAIINDLRQRKQQVQSQLSALAALHGDERVTDLFRALDNAYQQGVWLSALAMHPLDPSGPSGTGNKVSPITFQLGKLPLTSMTPGHLAELKGHALNHQGLATFMQALGRQPGITQLILQDTRSSTFESTDILDFSLVVHLASAGASP